MHFLPCDKWIRNHVLFPKLTALWDFNIWFVWFCPPKKQAIALALERNTTVCHVDLSGVKGAEVWRGLGLLVVKIDAGFWDVFPRFEFWWLVFFMFVASWKPCEDVYSTHFTTPNKSWDQLWHKKSPQLIPCSNWSMQDWRHISNWCYMSTTPISFQQKDHKIYNFLLVLVTLPFSRWWLALSHTTWRWIMWILAMRTWVSKERRHPGRLDFQCQKPWRGELVKSLFGEENWELKLKHVFFVILVMTDTQHAHGSKKYLKQILNSFFVGSDFFSRARWLDSQMFWKVRRFKSFIRARRTNH